MSIIVMDADSTTVVLNGFPIVDFAEGDVVELRPVNDHTSHVNAANGGVNIKRRVDCGVSDLILRVQKYSPSDQFLNSAINSESPVVFNGSAKESFKRDGVDGVETYTLENGSITTQPGNVKNNTDNNGMMEYTLRFRNAIRGL